MRRHIRVPVSTIEELQKELEALPAQEPDNVSRREAVKLLTPTLEQMLKRGYDATTIAALLSRKGIEITPGVLKNYISSARRSKPQRAGQAARKHPRGKTHQRDGNDPHISDATPEPPEEPQSSEQPRQELEQRPYWPQNGSAQLAPTSSRNPSSSSITSENPQRKSLFSVNEDTQDI